jgi:chaperonin GroES
MPLRPLSDRVVVIRSVASAKAGSLYVPDNAQEKPVQGRIIAVGSGKRLQSGKQCEMTLEVGQQVLFAKYSGTEVEMDGIQQLLLREDDILGIIEEERPETD